MIDNIFRASHPFLKKAGFSKCEDDVDKDNVDCVDYDNNGNDDDDDDDDDDDRGHFTPPPLPHPTSFLSSPSPPHLSWSSSGAKKEGR